MEIYLIRHGIAVERGTPGYPNDDRPLTDEGRQKLRKAAKGIATLVSSFDLVVSSPLVRALETAQIVAKAIHGNERVQTSDALLPLAAPAEIAALLSRNRECKRVLLAGHEPNMSRLATYLIGGDAAVIEFKKGTLCRIDVAGRTLRSPGLLIYALPPKVLRQLGKKSVDELIESDE